MAVFTREQKTKQIEAWNTALLKCAAGQEYVIGSRRLRRADLPEIRSTLDWLNAQPTVEDELAGRGTPRFTQLVPGRGGRGEY